MQTAKDWHIEDNERGKKLTIFPTEGRKERGGRCKGWTCLRMKQISLTLNSDYSVVKIPLTTGLDNYPEEELTAITELYECLSEIEVSKLWVIGIGTGNED